jgi:hypothetical protein
MNPRLKFIGNFYSYSGLGLFYKSGAKEENAPEEVKRAALITSQSLDKVESSLMSIYNCNP